MNPRLIALCSPAMGSGKSTVADYLVSQHGFEKLSFATPLKATAAEFLRQFGMSRLEITQRLYGGSKEEVIPGLGVSARHICQTIGTEWGRKCISPTVWIDVTLQRAKSLLNNGLSVVIDDLRFPNEYGAVTLAHGDCYRVVRPDAKVTIAHASEGQTDLIHMNEIRNDGDLNALHAEVDRVLGFNI